MQNSYIGITENRLHHILAVARRCYDISKSRGFTEDFCRMMWMIGWTHDVGYEFSTVPGEHPFVGDEMLGLLNSESIMPEDGPRYAVRFHGDCVSKKTVEWEILNIADLTVDSKGNIVDVSERLNDIKERYGEQSFIYLKACNVAHSVGLL